MGTHGLRNSDSPVLRSEQCPVRNFTVITRAGWPSTCVHDAGTPVQHG
jgi:hypothetical protein